MGLIDAFSCDDRIDLKVNDLVSYFRNEARVYAENTVMINGLRAGLPAEHILIMTGKLGTDCLNKTDIKED